MSRLDLQRITDPELWRGLQKRSPQATRFLDPEFLALFGAEVRYYGVFRSGVCIMGIPVIDPRRLGSPHLPWVYRQGPIFFDEIYRSAPAKLTQYQVELAEFGLTELARVEPWFRLTLHPSLTDIRGYDWVHYHEPDKARCKVLPRYTAILSLDGTSCGDVRKGARSARRQEEGYAKTREQLHVGDGGTIDELIELYLETFARQGTEVPDLERALFSPYITYFMDAGVGQILTVRDSEGAAVAAAFVFKDYDDVWHVPLIGTSDSRYGGTLLYFHIADFALEHGGKAVDFDGANSPNRAYFKHSLGAEAVPYFEIRYEAQDG